MEVRDPIYGGIELTADEAAVVHQPFVQRLRQVRQLGFSHLPFPCALHSRFAHSLGVMHIAGQAFDRAYRGWSFDHPSARERFRATVRLAALSHDLGHAPFSHCSEFAMPPVAELGIPWGRLSEEDRRATHEDFTIAILALSSVGREIDARFPCTSRHVACLIAPEVRPSDEFFMDGGLNHRRLLSQIISSELDADRLDYLVRDAYFSGARYGTIDVTWILSNLSAHTVDGQVSMALDSRALYAFEDFLVSRHHMFLQVYFHHKSVVYEEMLRRFVQSTEHGWVLPADLETYLYEDDIALLHRLRSSSDPWARRIVEQREFRRVIERHGPTTQVRVDRELAMLEAAGIESIVSASTGRLSRYALGPPSQRAGQLYVKERLPGQRAQRVRTLSRASTIFERYADAHSIARIYVAPEQRQAAWDVLGIREG